MHLFYLNVTHQMYEHWQSLSPFTEHPENPSPVKEKYSIPHHLWKNIEEDLIKSAKLFPSSLGEQFRSLKPLKKASQWKTWAHILSPVLLKGRLPEPYYSHWITLAKAFRIATSISITLPQLQFVESTILSFVQHYEKEYYQFKYHRLSICKPVIHALLHVVQCI